MATIKARGELLDVLDQVNLTVSYKDSTGAFVDPDIFPLFSLIQPDGRVFMNPTRAGVEKIDVGRYRYVLSIPFNASFGIWNDIWQASINGDFFENSFMFAVLGTEVPASPNSDGYAHLGDASPYEFSQVEIKNLNFLLKMLRARLNSDGKTLTKDQFGNEIYITCSAFSTDTLVALLALSLSNFNVQPHFTNFTWYDTDFINLYGAVLVEHAAASALLSKALIERGAESTITSQGITFTPASMGDMLKGQGSELYTAVNAKILDLKKSLRSFPIGLGSFSMYSGQAKNSVISKLKHLRERRLI